MKLILGLLVPAALAVAASCGTITPAQAGGNETARANALLPGVELVRDRRQWDRQGGWDNGDSNWDNGDNRRHRRHRHHHREDNYFPGIGFSFGFAPQYYAPRQDCFRDEWGRLYCSAY